MTALEGEIGEALLDRCWQRVNDPTEFNSSSVNKEAIG